MFVELIDLLRCPRLHEDSWLVASAEETVARHIVRGTLGCPVCHAEYLIRDGVADFGPALDARWSPLGEPVTGIPRRDDETLRLAALLDLAPPGGTVALAVGWQRVASSLVDLTGVRALLLDPSGAPSLEDGVSAVRGGGIPVAAASLRGVALDARTADASCLTAAVRALRRGGRLVAPAHVALPAGVRELARDTDVWVAERDSADAAIVKPVQIAPRR